MKTVAGIAVLICSLSFVGCARPKVAYRVKLMSTGESVDRGKAVGAVEGKDCSWHIFQLYVGGAPSLTKALATVEEEKRDDLLDHFREAEKKEKPKIRYLNNVRTEIKGFNTLLFGQDCLHVNAVGYM
jgi:hypothetical protein